MEQAPLKVCKNIRMKRIFSAIAIIGLFISISSCKTKEKCPAYGKVTPKNSTEVHS